MSLYPEDFRGFTTVAVSVSYPAEGVWHWATAPWIGPVRLTGENAKLWAERYFKAAQAQFQFKATIAVFTEWGDLSNPHRSLKNGQP